MYKTKLQELCHQRRWGLPMYSAMKDGPDHIPSFKASVSLSGLTFDSPAPSTSSKHAQNEAAKLAFLHFTSSPTSPSPTTGGFNKNPAFSYSDFKENEALESNAIESNQNLTQEPPPLSSFAKKEVSESSPEQCPSSPAFSQLDLSALSISDSNKAKTPETSSYLLCNRIRVYTSFPDISFPEGITVLPIRENRWVAVSLEFPNENGH